LPYSHDCTKPKIANEHDDDQWLFGALPPDSNVGIGGCASPLFTFLRPEWPGAKLDFAAGGSSAIPEILRQRWIILIILVSLW
jgi:hypothetical protein